GLAYPLVSGYLFEGGMLANGLHFVDTAGGCVVHVLGGTFGLMAALWIGPRSKMRAWNLLGKVPIPEGSDNTPLKIIGAFFLWFGWLGFNSGNTNNWTAFLTAFTNTNIGASAGGLVGLVFAIMRMGRSTTTMIVVVDRPIRIM